jgi:hypothetical protein
MITAEYIEIIEKNGLSLHFLAIGICILFNTPASSASINTPQT